MAGVTWRLLSSNNRDLSRSGAGFPDVDACLRAVDEVRAAVTEVEPVIHRVSRLAWACGYMVEESYFIPSGKVNGVTGLSRARKFVGSDGSFANAMAEKRPDSIARRRINWDWGSNPFVGTKELSGLAILNCLLSNWDAKTTNNNVLGMYDGKGGVKDWYLVADWGGTFGKTGGFLSHTKWDLADYSKQRFIDGAKGGAVNFHYSGKMSALRSVPSDHARWFVGVIGKLSDNQLRDAFRAAGATQSETEGSW